MRIILLDVQEINIGIPNVQIEYFIFSVILSIKGYEMNRDKTVCYVYNFRIIT